MLKIPVDTYSNVLTLLKLEYFAPLFEYLDYTGRKNLSLHVVNSALDNGNQVLLSEQAEIILGMVAPLIKDQTDQPEEVSIEWRLTKAGFEPVISGLLYRCSTSLTVQPYKPYILI